MDTLILNLLDPEEARTPPMAMKDYSDEFKADAVALYESTPGATYKGIAVGVRSAGAVCGLECCGTANAAGSPCQPCRQGSAEAPAPAAGPEADEQIRRLEARVRELATERDILRKAAKYFADEANW
ncbi:transposase (plasmid) [Streptomyces sp. NBC_01527]|uniref:transposase n=1 Tax=unclassified Streptomyces TaxID=2593676 RepID=UPI002E0FCEDE